MNESILEGQSPQRQEELLAGPHDSLDGQAGSQAGHDEPDYQGTPPLALADDAETPDGDRQQEFASHDTPGPVDLAAPAATEAAVLQDATNTPSSSPVEAATSEGDVSGAAVDANQGQAGMQNLMQDFDRDFRSPRRGDVLDGVVVRIDKDSIMVDIGTKSEGIIPSHEMQHFGTEEVEKLRLGDEVLVYVVQPENQNGHVVLSLSRARAERGWRTVQKQFEEGETVEAEVVDFNRGGLIVNIDGVRGFVPISQVVGLRHDGAGEGELETKMAGMVGRHVFLKIIEVNRSRNRLILSERVAMQQIRAQRKEQLLVELQEGEIRHGRVTSLCEFGAFIDLGGADGLVHLSELSWGQVVHPSDIVRVGDEVDVYVLGVDREKKKIALSLRRSQPGPWARIAEKYTVGDLVTGTITKLASFGAFARIEEGVEGLIHVSELGEGHIPHPRNVVKEGDSLTLRVIRIDAARRRLGLSLKQADDQTPEATMGVPPADPVSGEPAQATAAAAEAPQEPVTEVTSEHEVDAGTELVQTSLATLTASETRALSLLPEDDFSLHSE